MEQDDKVKDTLPGPDSRGANNVYDLITTRNMKYDYTLVGLNMDYAINFQRSCMATGQPKTRNREFAAKEGYCRRSRKDDTGKRIMAAWHLDTNAFSTILLQGPFCALVPRMRQVAQPVSAVAHDTSWVAGLPNMNDSARIDTYVKKV